MASAATTTLRSLLLTTALLVLVPAAAHARDIHVNASSSTPSAECGTADGPCRTLADAVQHAAGGDRLIVAPGRYAGTLIPVPLTMLGAHADQPATTRAIDVAKASIITSQLTLAADVAVNGFSFPARAASTAAIKVSGDPYSGPLVTNNVIGGAGVELATTAPIRGLRINDNRFVGQATARPIRLLGHNHASSNTSIEGNTFEGYGSVSAIHATNSPNLEVSSNRLVGTAPLLLVGQTSGIDVHGNVGTDMPGTAVRVSGSSSNLSLVGNAFAGTGGSLLDITGGDSTDITLTQNDVTGFARVVSILQANGYAGTLIARANRLLISEAGTAHVSGTASIDLRANWWGSNVAPAATDRFDTSSPLRLTGVDVAGELTVGGSTRVGARLTTDLPEQLPQLLHLVASFATTGGTLGATSIPFNWGEAHTFLTAGASAGTATITARLDDQAVSSTIRFIAPAPQIANSPVPGAANTKASTRPKRANTRTSIAVSRASLKRALSRGVRVTVRSTRAGRYNVAIVIPHFEARRLGLRKRSSKLRTDFVIGRVSGTKRVGSRTVRVKLTKRARYAIRHADRRIWFTTQVRYRRTGSKLPPVTMVRHNALQSNVR